MKINDFCLLMVFISLIPGIISSAMEYFMLAYFFLVMEISFGCLIILNNHLERRKK